MLKVNTSKLSFLGRYNHLLPVRYSKEAFLMIAFGSDYVCPLWILGAVLFESTGSCFDLPRVDYYRTPCTAMRKNRSLLLLLIKLYKRLLRLSTDSCGPSKGV